MAGMSLIEWGVSESEWGWVGVNGGEWESMGVSVTTSVGMSESKWGSEWESTGVWVKVHWGYVWVRVNGVTMSENQWEPEWESMGCVRVNGGPSDNQLGYEWVNGWVRVVREHWTVIVHYTPTSHQQLTRTNDERTPLATLQLNHSLPLEILFHPQPPPHRHTLLLSENLARSVCLSTKSYSFF